MQPYEGVEEGDENRDEGGAQPRKSRDHCPETKFSAGNDIPSMATNESDVGGARVKGGSDCFACISSSIHREGVVWVEAVLDATCGRTNLLLHSGINRIC